ncbi:MAG TPA: mechanosensitive ion channel family protein [Candidatus Binatus sp.]|uniref:mechanosensitive ion channel family protein n=1 Tax=Candidatus Binatus sp. TaxID=2811406 RepID=UPI002B49837D|nr:mechanosensitive ion channel family protein [Candidatus Binatus sp.]HKN13697.1 mechanosensitive ion channel family protein [Candidatus Binatus sp.]
MPLFRLIQKSGSSRIVAATIAIAIAIASAPASAQGPATASQGASAAPSVAAAAAPQPAAAASPAAVSTAAAASRPDAHTVISYLSDVINWYGHLGVEAQLVRDPDETLFFADDRQTAGEVLKLAFEYARAQAAYLAKAGSKPAAAGTAAAPAVAPGAAGLGNVTQSLHALDAAASKLRARIKDLQAQLAKAPAAKRNAIASEIQGAQNELDLNQARVEALNALAQYESGSAAPDQNAGLIAQIDELEHSISDSSKKTLAPAETALAASTEPTGILGLVTELFALSNKLDALEQNRALAQALSTRAAGVRNSILALITTLDARGNALAQGAGAADIASLKDRKQAFENLLDEHRLLSASALPLSKQIVLLGIYTKNLGRWHDAISQRWKREFRSLLIRLIVLGASLLIIFLGSIVWRWLTNRYVTDIRRRGQVMAARRLVLGIIIVVVVMVNFADELGSAATVVGFAAAGIAVALQNVILSIAGYFFLIGRFGIKAGDRVQIGGVTGDVIDIGLVKLSLMELGGTGTHREPTGRVAVFSNAIVFQPSGNFFKQAPGTSFVWNEVRLTLAPDIDYRLAEKRLLDAVNEVFARYRDRVMRDYRHLERDLNIMLETPKPQSRLHLSQSGLEIVIRYPAETYSAPQITDEISRRVLDAINREPSLRLAPQGSANIQSQVPPSASGEDGAEQPADANGQAAADAPSATAGEEKSAGTTRANK